MLRGVVAFIAFLAFWLLLSGHFTPFLVIAGIGSSLAVLWASRRMEVVDREGVPMDLWRVLFFYWPWLSWQIVKSAWDVGKIIVDPRLPISPTLVRFRPLQQGVVGLVTHANSITLTPGTITIEASDGEFLVHGLTLASANGAVGSEMDHRLRRLEMSS
ncbi:MAG: Na+/H+ antiporter subunit E [Ramlibacter sp.]